MINSNEPNIPRDANKYKFFKTSIRYFEKHCRNEHYIYEGYEDHWEGHFEHVITPYSQRDRIIFDNPYVHKPKDSNIFKKLGYGLFDFIQQILGQLLLWQVAYAIQNVYLAVKTTLLFIALITNAIIYVFICPFLSCFMEDSLKNYLNSFFDALCKATANEVCNIIELSICSIIHPIVQMTLIITRTVATLALLITCGKLNWWEPKAKDEHSISYPQTNAEQAQDTIKAPKEAGESSADNPEFPKDCANIERAPHIKAS